MRFHVPLDDTGASLTTDADRTVALAFAANVVLAGGNSVAVRFSNRELAPLWGATLRFALAALLLIAVMLAMKQALPRLATKLALPRGRALRGAILYGLFQFGGAFGFAYYALVRIQAGLGQTLLALVPLATLLLAVAQGQETLRRSAVVGTLLGLTGVVVISGDPLRESVPLLSLLAVLGSVLCFAQAAVLVRRFPPLHPVIMNLVGMVAGAALLFALSALAGEPRLLPRRVDTWAALTYMVVVGSILVFLLYIFILQRWSASRAAYVMVLIPFVTVVLSAWLDDEPVRGSLIAGGLLVLTGVYVGALRRSQSMPA